MSEAEHDNSWLKPYLQKIHEAGGAIYKDESEEVFRAVFASEHPDDNDPAEYIGASKIRQTMYIAKLARQARDEIVLTEKGRDFIGAE